MTYEVHFVSTYHQVHNESVAHDPKAVFLSVIYAMMDIFRHCMTKNSHNFHFF